MMTVYWFVLLAIGAIACFALMLSWRLLRVVRKLQQQVRNLQATEVRKPSEQAAPVSFSASLGQAERKAAETKIQFKGGSQADKYRYVASLADQGLNAAAIATAMQMSIPEVEQALSLARLRPKQQAVVSEA